MYAYTDEKAAVSYSYIWLGYGLLGQLYVVVVVLGAIAIIAYTATNELKERPLK